MAIATQQSFLCLGRRSEEALRALEFFTVQTAARCPVANPVETALTHAQSPGATHPPRVPVVLLKISDSLVSRFLFQFKKKKKV